MAEARRSWTATEMIVTLGITGCVVGLGVRLWELEQRLKRLEDPPVFGSWQEVALPRQAPESTAPMCEELPTESGQEVEPPHEEVEPPERPASLCGYESESEEAPPGSD